MPCKQLILDCFHSLDSFVQTDVVQVVESFPEVRSILSEFSTEKLSSMREHAENQIDQFFKQEMAYGIHQNSQFMSSAFAKRSDIEKVKRPTLKITTKREWNHRTDRYEDINVRTEIPDTRTTHDKHAEYFRVVSQFKLPHVAVAFQNGENGSPFRIFSF